MELKASKLYESIKETRRFQRDNQIRNQNILPYTTIFFPLLNEISRDFSALDIWKYRATAENIERFWKISSDVAISRLFSRVFKFSRWWNFWPKFLTRFLNCSKNIARWLRISRAAQEYHAKKRKYHVRNSVRLISRVSFSTLLKRTIRRVFDAKSHPKISRKFLEPGLN